MWVSSKYALTHPKQVALSQKTALLLLPTSAQVTTGDGFIQGENGSICLASLF